MTDRVDRIEAFVARYAAAIVAGVLSAAFVVHLLLIPAAGWERDQYWFATWMRAAVDRGVAHVSESTWCDYPPGYLYVLQGLGLLWTALTGGSLPADGTVALRFLIKLVPSLTDLVTAWVLYRMARARHGRVGIAALLVLAGYAFNPAIIFDSAVWGQADALPCLILLLSVWAVGARRFVAGGALLAVAVLVKLQAVVVLPALVLATVFLGGLDGLFAVVKGAACAALVLLAPFYATHRMDSVAVTIFGASGRYPYISMNAHNVWWLVGGAQSTAISDVMRVGNGLLTYRALGTVMFAAATWLIGFRLWRDLYRSRREPLPALIEAVALQLLAFSLFPTEMHERYIIPALPFLAALCLWKPRFAWLYAVCSIAVLFSLASTLNASYPQPLGPIAWLLRADRAETFALCAIFLAVFLTLLFWTPDRRFRLAARLTIGLVAAATVGVATIPLHSTQLLSDWEPIEAWQQWGATRHDRSVDDHRLSAFGFMFRHGIGTHADSKLTYHLNGDFRAFDTAFAVDDEGNRGQKIRFRILADGTPRFDSGDISASGFPRHVQVPVDGVQLLTLEVLDGGDGNSSDHADWLEPVLLR